MKTKFFVIIAIGVLLASCSPEKRLARMIDKHPDLFKEKTVLVAIHDTIIEKDTIYLERVVHDTMFNRIPGKESNLLLDTDEFKTTVEIVPEFKKDSETGKVRIVERVKIETVVKEKRIIKRATVPIVQTVPVKVTVPKPIITKRTPRWAWFMLSANLLILIALGWLFRDFLAGILKQLIPNKFKS
jgi:hypothetical protein